MEKNYLDNLDPRNPIIRRALFRAAVILNEDKHMWPYLLEHYEKGLERRSSSRDEKVRD